MSECSVPNAVLQDRAWQQTPHPRTPHTHTHVWALISTAELESSTFV